MRLALVYIEVPLYLDDNGFSGRSIMNMLRHFPQVFETELICGVDDNDRGEGYIEKLASRGSRGFFGDLSLMGIHPLPPWNGIYDLHSSRFLPIAWRIFNIFRDRHKTWDAVWIVNSGPITQFCFLLAKFYNIPTVLYLRGDARKEILSRKGKKNWLARLVADVYLVYLDIAIPAMLRRCMGIVTGGVLFDKYKSHAKALHLYVASAITQEDLCSEPKKFNNNKALKLIYVGHLVGYKGVDILLKSLAILKERGNSFSLDIVGSGPMEQEWRALSETLGLTETVSFKGEVPFGEKLFSLYSKADIYALPSYTEGTPKAVTEAMAFGLPVVASRVGGLPDLVEEGIEGFLIEPGNPEKLSGIIQKFYENNNLLLEMSGNALQKAKQFTIERQLQKVKVFLEFNINR